MADSKGYQRPLSPIEQAIIKARDRALTRIANHIIQAKIEKKKAAAAETVQEDIWGEKTPTPKDKKISPPGDPIPDAEKLKMELHPQITGAFVGTLIAMLKQHEINGRPLYIDLVKTFNATMSYTDEFNDTNFNDTLQTLLKKKNVNMGDLGTQIRQEILTPLSIEVLGIYTKGNSFGR